MVDYKLIANIFGDFMGEYSAVAEPPNLLE